MDLISLAQPSPKDPLNTGAVAFWPCRYQEVVLKFSPHIVLSIQKKKKNRKKKKCSGMIAL
jgi:hypothetical protein